MPPQLMASMPPPAMQAYYASLLQWHTSHAQAPRSTAAVDASTTPQMFMLPIPPTAAFWPFSAPATAAVSVKEQKPSRTQSSAGTTATTAEPAPGSNQAADGEVDSQPSSCGLHRVKRPESSSSQGASGLSEAELKLQKRKQANRESARRSKLRKKEESESLSMRAQALSMEGVVLRSELARLHGVCDTLRSENTALQQQVFNCCGAATVDRLRRSATPCTTTATAIATPDLHGCMLALGPPGGAAGVPALFPQPFPVEGSLAAAPSWQGGEVEQQAAPSSTNQPEQATMPNTPQTGAVAVKPAAFSPLSSPVKPSPSPRPILSPIAVRVPASPSIGDCAFGQQSQSAFAQFVRPAPVAVQARD
eukprot:jgi/Chlat1/8749/Chrsp9S00723